MIVSSKHQRLPYTHEWFVRFREINPRQAEITARVVAHARCHDACAICGECGATRYQRIEPPALLIYLCDDCRDLQQAMYGLRVRPAMESAPESSVSDSYQGDERLSRQQRRARERAAHKQARRNRGRS